MHSKTLPSVWIAVLWLLAQSIPTSGWKMLFDFRLWYRHLIGNRCLSQNIFVTVTTPPSHAPLFIADCALVFLQGLAHLMMGDQGMGSVPFPLCFHCFFLFCSCFETITANDGQMLESCLWLQINMLNVVLVTSFLIFFSFVCSVSFCPSCLLSSPSLNIITEKRWEK